MSSMGERSGVVLFLVLSKHETANANARVCIAPRHRVSIPFIDTPMGNLAEYNSISRAHLIARLFAWLH